jgi:hypothetical protein
MITRASGTMSVAARSLCLEAPRVHSRDRVRHQISESARTSGGKATSYPSPRTTSAITPIAFQAMEMERDFA